MTLRSWPYYLVGLLFATASVPSYRATELGDPAPALHIDRWVQGDPVDLEESRGKEIIVVEFWATWCGPCRTSIPHLTELQAQLADRDVRIMGVTDEKISVVEPFLKRMGDEMKYTVAIDDEQKTFANYMKAFGIGGIPHAFVIDKEGKLVWQGHPMDGLNEALEQILAGTYDVAAAREEARAAQLIPRYVGMITAESVDPEASKTGRAILDHYHSDSDFLNDLAWYILTDEGVRHRDLALARDAAQKAYEITQGKSADVNDTLARALFDNGQVKEAIAMQKKALAVNETPDEETRLQKTLERYQSNPSKP